MRCGSAGFGPQYRLPGPTARQGASGHWPNQKPADELHKKRRGRGRWRTSLRKKRRKSRLLSFRLVKSSMPAGQPGRPGGQHLSPSPLTSYQGLTRVARARFLGGAMRCGSAGFDPHTDFQDPPRVWVPLEPLAKPADELQKKRRGRGLPRLFLSRKKKTQQSASQPPVFRGAIGAPVPACPSGFGV
jgi:hypothetical protein